MVKYQAFTVSFSPVLSQRDLWLCTRVHWGEEIIRLFRGLLDTGSELKPILGDPKQHYGHSVKVGAYGCQVINGNLAQV